ncbi:MULTISPECIES: hypothetical protein [unclassified Erythrobacter]|jgi:hypothetical protein|uniref:hypothetical protein n=1 Tax=unclassified Erythrobacter TaxID=2633097 RepID=UPI0007B7DD0A|nr:MULTISPECIES: hypothetical protein [unclassified Erythrobacter]KZY90626.1 hypothetical protein A3745_06340 [Erythrobacter sp. HI0074]KZZ08016.1 hypothetical protein A3748_12855 [Erythrobacter sp. HI0077]
MAARSHTVEPSRLAYGAWCHATDKQIGEGDIRASYSADRIGMGQPIRKPFRYAGELWVCVGTGPSGAEAYRLVHASVFDGTARTYHDRCSDGDHARGDPAGFYDGIIVHHAGRDLVMAGPPVMFVAGEESQLSLF